MAVLFTFVSISPASASMRAGVEARRRSKDCQAPRAASQAETGGLTPDAPETPRPDRKVGREAA